VARRRCSDPFPLASTSTEAVKPDKGWLPQVKAYSGRKSGGSDRSPEAFFGQLPLRPKNGGENKNYS
jgi:hypothetical protein